MAEDVAREYSDSLAGLTFNSKIHINVLTELAQENLQYADTIAAAIEDHLSRVPPEQKLPCLYLMDSIMKNIDSNVYKERFARNIVQKFGQAFDMVDEKTRLSMWKLRKTWPSYFPENTLYALDILINSKDPNWPIQTPSAVASDEPIVPSSIHVNPSFLRQKEAEEQQRVADELLRAEIEAQVRREREMKEEKDMERKAKEAEEKRREAEHRMLEQAIQAQERELLRLQQQRIEQELQAAKRNLQKTQDELERTRQEEAKKKQALQLEKKMQEKNSRKRESEDKDKVEVPPKKNCTTENKGTKNKVSTDKDSRPTKSKDDRARVDKKSKPENSNKKDHNSKKPKETVKAPANNEQAGKISDALADLFGTEDVDYRKMKTIPKRSSTKNLPLLEHQTSQHGWTKFKQGRPEEFPYRQPRDVITEFQSPLHRQYSNDAGRMGDDGYGDQQHQQMLNLRNMAEIKEKMDERLREGLISDQQYHELTAQLQELYELQEHQLRRQQGRTGPSYGLGWKKQPPNRPSAPRKTRPPGYVHSEHSQSPVYDEHSRSPLFGDVAPCRPPLLPPPPPPPIVNKPSRALLPSPRVPAVLPPAPRKALVNGIYVPENDFRFYVRAKKESITNDMYTVIFNSRHYYVRARRPLTIFLGIDYGATLNINSDTKEVFINQIPVFYLGEPQRKVNIEGRQHTLFVHGPAKKIWIDGNLYEVFLDAPVNEVNINNELHSVAIDSSANEVYIDNILVCPYDSEGVHRIFLGGVEHTVQLVAPLRQILIDGQMCDLDLSRKFPSVMVNGERRGIMFDGEPRQMIIDGNEFTVAMDRPLRAQLFGKLRMHHLAFGGPGHEVIIDEELFEVKFGGPPVQARLPFRRFTIQLPGPAPDVKILGVMKTIDELRDYKAPRLLPPPMPNVPLLPNAIPPLLPAAPIMGNSLPHLAVAPIPSVPQPIVIPPNRTAVTNPHVQPIMDPLSNAVTQVPLYTATTPVLGNGPSPLDVNSLFSKLVNAGIIVSATSQPPVTQVLDNQPQALGPTPLGLGNQPLAPGPMPPEAGNQPLTGGVAKVAPPQEVVPDLTAFKLDIMKKPFKSVLARLKDGKQCASCGMRLRPDLYQMHLDWHFRKNRREKEESRVLHNRQWYPSITEWVHYEEVLDVRETQASSFFENMLLSVHNAIKEESSVAHIENAESEPLAMENPEDNVCSVCNDSLDQYYNEELEEWRLRDAIKVGDLLYHPVCYEDSNEAKARSPGNENEEAEQTISPELPDPITNPVQYLTALAEKAKLTNQSIDSVAKSKGILGALMSGEIKAEKPEIKQEPEEQHVVEVKQEKDEESHEESREEPMDTTEVVKNEPGSESNE